MYMGMSDAQFKAFLREQQSTHKRIKEELENNNYESAEELINALIERTQENIEDL